MLSAIILFSALVGFAAAVRLSVVGLFFVTCLYLVGLGALVAKGTIGYLALMAAVVTLHATYVFAGVLSSFLRPSK